MAANDTNTLIMELLGKATHCPPDVNDLIHQLPAALAKERQAAATTTNAPLTNVKINHDATEAETDLTQAEARHVDENLHAALQPANAEIKCMRTSLTATTAPLTHMPTAEYPTPTTSHRDGRMSIEHTMPRAAPSPPAFQPLPYGTTLFSYSGTRIKEEADHHSPSRRHSHSTSSDDAARPPLKRQKVVDPRCDTKLRCSPCYRRDRHDCNGKTNCNNCGEGKCFYSRCRFADECSNWDCSMLHPISADGERRNKRDEVWG